MLYEIQCGKPYPLGATWAGKGVNFALFSEHANKVILCLFNDVNNPKDVVELALPMNKNHIFYGFVPNLKPGQLYGYRIDGPYEPTKGHRFNKNKLLLDPYAKALAGTLKWEDAIFGYNKNEDDLSFNKLDSAPFVPKAVIINPEFNWEGDVLHEKEYHDLIIYELNIKGFSELLPGIPDDFKGKFSALVHPAALDYFAKLGITAIELMPVQFFISNSDLEEKRLSNFWGYNTIGFFAPHTDYTSASKHGEQVIEFKNMVKTLHQQGIEVILDVVYNHTGEGTELGPTLSFRGIDNLNYYRMGENNARSYTDFTGTGNTLDVRQPWVLQLIMDSLRYWVTEMHVDGFRFDLAATLARGFKDVDQFGAFFSIIYQDPIISKVKLIAEPWDVGDNGYQVGNFPIAWAEWNGKFRDDLRLYWKKQPIDLKTFILRLLGSPDIYKSNGRTPTSSINFITAHDGYTLHDLVTYEQKHNEKNGSNNTDGTDKNNAKNWGIEGETDDQGIILNRKKHQKNLLTTLFIAQGVPMLLAGDELNNSQDGNNNAYSQDNKIGWINWENQDEVLFKFTQRLIETRKKFPILRQCKWAYVDDEIRSDTTTITLFTPTGEEIFFKDGKGHCPETFGILLKEKSELERKDNDKVGIGLMLLIVFNSSEKQIDFRLPSGGKNNKWQKVIDTDQQEQIFKNTFDSNSNVLIKAFSVVILSLENEN